MKFADALEKVYDEEEKKYGTVFANKNLLTVEETKIAAKVWNAVAIALAEKGLDDFIIISNGSIVSIPLKQEKASDESETDKTKGKGKSPKTETAQNDAVNVKEKPEKENTESAESVK